ncbi:MAG: hypothetical protein AAFN70_18320, partial [Planctomycetota bacterium]
MDDAISLIREFRPGKRFVDAAEESAAIELAQLLDSFTLAVELSAAFLSKHPDIRIADYSAALRSDGLQRIESIAEDRRATALIRHREKQLSTIIEQTIRGPSPTQHPKLGLTDDARRVLQFAAISAPNHLVMDWLFMAAGIPQREDLASPDPRLVVWNQLCGLR